MKPNGSNSGRRRFSRRRLIMFAFEAIILLAVIEYFLVRPGSDSEPPAPVAAPRWRAVKPLGDKAIKLAGLQEAPDARLPPVDELAPGSSAARSAQEITSSDYHLPVETVNSIGMRFRLIPPGTSLIGSPATEFGRGEVEEQHVAAVPLPFYIADSEVTQVQWEAVMSDNPSGFVAASNPVEETSWYECQRFCVALSKLEDVPVGTYRLPSEEEWEYACRAGTSTAFCFGDDPSGLGDYADYADNNYRSTNAVKMRLPNAYGLYDMHGNVWEWCLDLYKPYGETEPRDPETEGWRILRGGNWYEPAENCRSANRCRLPPASAGNMLGFRVVRSLKRELDSRQTDVRQPD